MVDDDGLNNAVYSYQWIADGVDISGATGACYTLIADDEGKHITVIVSFTDDRNHQETLTVGNVGSLRGFWKSPGMGELAPDGFSLNGEDYPMEALADYGIRFNLILDKPISANFTLQVELRGREPLTSTLPSAPRLSALSRSAVGATRGSSKSHVRDSRRPPAHSRSLTTHNRVPVCIERGLAERRYAQIWGGGLGHYSKLLRRTVLGRSLVASKITSDTSHCLAPPDRGQRGPERRRFGAFRLPGAHGLPTRI